jgi:transmembrane sensor
MTERHRHTPTLDQLVLRWIRLLPSGDPHVRAAFAAFTGTSPKHLAAYLRQKILSVELTALDPERRIDVRELIDRARRRGNIIPWTGPEPAPARAVLPRRAHPVRTLGLAAGLVIGVGAGLALLVWSLSHRSADETTYRTGIGEQRQIGLPDGSTLRLNTRSRVRVELTSTRRVVWLLEGEVFFKVHHDPRRPFEVRVGHGLLEDLGTQFNVRVRPDSVTVSVAEGQVRLSQAHSDATDFPIELKAGEAAVISPDAQSTVPRREFLTPQQLTQRISWTRGVVIFSGETLTEAVAEMNRYNQLQLAVADPGIALMRIGGAFNALDPMAFVAGLTVIGVRSDAATVLRTHDNVIHLATATSQAPGPEKFHVAR